MIFTKYIPIFSFVIDVPLLSHIKVQTHSEVDFQCSESYWVIMQTYFKPFKKGTETAVRNRSTQFLVTYQSSCRNV
jgi:hypothetical protein